MLNNQCWYRLEKFWSVYKNGGKKSHIDELYAKATAAFKELEPALASDEIASNALDTAAWFCLCSLG